MARTKEFLWKPESGSWPEIWVARWTDPCSEIKNVWMSPDQVSQVNPLSCLAVGFLVERTKKAIKLAGSVCANGHSGQVLAIETKSLDFLGKLADVGRPGR